MEAGHKKNVLFGKLLRVCDKWRGSARIGCWRKREVEKMSNFVSKVVERKI